MSRALCSVAGYTVVLGRYPMRLLIHAGGYQVSPWSGNEMTEIRTTRGEVSGCEWAPTNPDFLAAGSASGGSLAAADVARMIQVIGDQAVESIEELRIIGHSNSEVFALGGSTRCDDVHFTSEPAIIGDSPTFKAAIPRCRAVQDRLTRDAKVILLGCNGGSGSQELLSLLSHAFLRTAAGFKEKIKYTIEYGPTQLPGNTLILQGPDRTRVTSRGKMMYESLGQLFGSWQSSAWNLRPDATSNDGDVFIGARDKDRSRGATTLFWMILREFYPGHPWVSGTSVDAGVANLRLRYNEKPQTVQGVQQSAGAHVDLNPDFGARTTPKTLKNRVAEIGKALDLVMHKKSGSVPMT
jgi:hypothetical protein